MIGARTARAGPTPTPTATPTATPTPGLSDCLCEVQNINPNQVSLKSVALRGKGSSKTRAMMMIAHAVDVPGATCDRGEFSDPTAINLRMVDDDGDVLVDSSETIVCEGGGVTTNVKRNVFFQGPKNCQGSDVPSDKSTGAITSTGTGSAGTAVYVEDTKITCRASSDLWISADHKLTWPIDCVPGETCYARIGYPDIDRDGLAFDCGAPGYYAHQGTDIGLLSWAQVDEGVDVFAAAPGEVLWVFDGKYDRCPNPDEPDCSFSGYKVCTPRGPYCREGTCCCRWCFFGGNVVVIRHADSDEVFATRYDHLKKNSIVVTPGEFVVQGQKIAQAASAGKSTGPHLHFEVWGTGFYKLADPWAGSCGPNFDNPLWAFDPPWVEP